jgi:citrate lyase subunit beta/citryl-CoA lyase
MRSILFVPGHDERKLAKVLDAGADVVIVDLEDGVPESEKPRAREIACEFVRAHRDRTRLFVRVNALSTGLTLDDLAAVVRAGPHGVMLPKATSGSDVAQVGAYLSALEKRDGIAEGSTRILAAAVFGMGSFAHDAGPRLAGMLWGGEDLATDCGATANRAAGLYTAPFELARSLCLFSAAAAGIPAIDAVFVDFRNLDALRAECHAAVAAGFSAKAAIHPAQVPVINEAFTPSEDARREAAAIVEAFARQPEKGAIAIGGRLFEKPHLRAAERVLSRAQ